MGMLHKYEYEYNFNINKMISRREIKGLSLTISRVGGKVAASLTIEDEKVDDVEVLRRMYPFLRYFYAEDYFITRPDYGKSGEEYFDQEYFCGGVFNIIINKMHKVEVRLNEDEYHFESIFIRVVERLRTVTEGIDAWLASEPDLDLKIPIV